MQLTRFREIVSTELLTSFCRCRPGHNPVTLNGTSLDKVDATDAEWFIAALDGGLVEERDGFFSAPLSKAKEQIFWSGEKNKSPRPISLWLEPVITIGAVARLCTEFHWPVCRIGMQSADWTFDLVCYAEDLEKEIVLCEVKKSVREIDRLVDLMRAFCRIRFLGVEPSNSIERNAYRKVQGIRRCWPQLVWALGPGRYEKIFSVRRDPGFETFHLDATGIDELNYQQR